MATAHAVAGSQRGNTRPAVRRSSRAVIAHALASPIMSEPRPRNHAVEMSQAALAIVSGKTQAKDGKDKDSTSSQTTGALTSAAIATATKKSIEEVSAAIPGRLQAASLQGSTFSLAQPGGH